MNENTSIQDWHNRFLQQARWTRELRGYLLKQIGLGERASILEVGCGTGAVLSEFFQATSCNAPPRIHGLDINPHFLNLASQNLPQVSLCLGDAHALPYRSKCFEMTYCHYLLLWVKDPLQVLTEMTRVTRIGGVVAALAEPDYGARIDYPEELERIGVLQRAALQHQGADPQVGRKLASLFKEAGLHSIVTGVLGGQWSSPPPEEEIEAEWKMIYFDISGLISLDELKQLHQKDINYWKEQERILYVPTFYAWGIV